jgi:lipopolysaccharide/colanic/teichoic acid biosynthesis glycosyltransferase
MIRFFDLFISILALIILLPVFLVIGLMILIGSGTPILFHQSRVGKGGRDFVLLKFRTMRTGAWKGSSITVGTRDSRITREGYMLRKYKVDELPQLFNVIRGEMSLVGPRPEVRKYVELYNEDQVKVLTVKPGITDYASLEYMRENELLGNSSDPERTYIEEIMPAKLELNRMYLENRSLRNYFRILGKTVVRIFS